jgi:hypothetical protein
MIDRPRAQEIVDLHTSLIGPFKAVSFDTCLKLLGSERFLLLRSDPIRREGPVKGTVYPWNLVDYLSNENPRQGSKR